MPKFFCASDAHGYFDELKAGLDKAGFEPDNKDHWFVSCGDALDRGGQPKEMLDFLMGLPQKILIRGNHEVLMDQMLVRGFPIDRDYHNRTLDTLQDLTEGKRLNRGQRWEECRRIFYPYMGETRFFFETQHYIFTHAWLPTQCPNGWRMGDFFEWENAIWRNPLKAARLKEVNIGKTVVSGHITSSYAWNGPGKEFDPNSKFEPYYCEDKLIMLDSGTPVSHKVNVVVLEDDFIPGNLP